MAAPSLQRPYQSVGADDASTLGSRSLGDGHADDLISFAGGTGGRALPRLVTAGHELESFCRAEMSGGSAAILGFPPTTLRIVRLLAGNHCCVDCGDEEQNRINYASIGYGTLLCEECAHRHATMSPEESIIKSLREDNWNFRSTLAMLEGGNVRMLDFVKHKPRWRPPKFSSDNVPEDVLAFKSIYLSKAAATYRKNLAKAVDDAFYKKVTEMREEDAAMDARLEKLASRSEKDPFQHILEQNDMSADEIPGFFDGSSPSRGIDPNIFNDGGGGSNRSIGASLAANRSRGRSINTPLMKHESPSVDLIKQRINMRRSMNTSIAARDQLRAIMEDGSRDGSANDNDTRDGASRFSPQRASMLASQLRGTKPAISDGSTAEIVSRYAPQRYRRGSGDNTAGLVGEVGDASIQDHDDVTTSLGDTAS